MVATIPTGVPRFATDLDRRVTAAVEKEILRKSALYRIYPRLTNGSRRDARVLSVILLTAMMLAQPFAWILYSVTPAYRRLARSLRAFRRRCRPSAEAVFTSPGNLSERIESLTDSCMTDLHTRGKMSCYPRHLARQAREVEHSRFQHAFHGAQKGNLVNFAKHRFNAESMLFNFFLFLSVPWLWFQRNTLRGRDKLLFISTEGRIVAPTRVRCFHFCEHINSASNGVYCEVATYYDTYLHNRGSLVETSRFPAGRFGWRMLLDILHGDYGVIVQQRPNYEFVVTLLAKWLLGDRLRLILDIDDFTFPERLHLMSLRLFRVSSSIDVLAPWADGFVVSSRHLVEYVKHRYPYHAPYLLPTYPGLRFLSGISPGQPNDANTRTVFAWMGTLFHPENLKDVLFILQAWLTARPAGAELHILGGGYFHTLLGLALGEEAASADIRIKGWLDPDAIPGYLAGVDVGIYCLTTDNDFMRSKSPTKLFEYWAYGKAVISTSLGEAGRFVRDGENGLLVDTREDMANAFSRLAADAQLRGRLGREGRRQVLEEWNQDAVCRCYAEILGRPDP